MSEHYVIHCRRCGSEMIERSRSTVDEGTLAESLDECPNCGLIREFLYGHWVESEREEDAMAASLVGMYDDREKSNGPIPGSYFQMSLSMCTVVEVVRNMNYGEHRFLSELIRQRKADPLYKTSSEFKQHTDRLEDLINEGYY